ncbi:GrpB family protein [Paenibacillus dendritiformis]|uniref:GrpB family protein n=1 Tax=Paenibacillus dendritiformis TaxID=130049 RepID=UPI00387E1A13
MNEYSMVVAHDPGWSEEFKEIGTRIRDALQDAALRIDHIGSTAVPGLDAKPIIDIQISVRSFEPLASYRDPLQAIGYLHRAGNPELTKRYFREGPGMRRTHIHVREAGSFAEQFALLFRDYLRVHPEEAGPLWSGEAPVSLFVEAGQNTLRRSERGLHMGVDEKGEPMESGYRLEARQAGFVKGLNDSLREIGNTCACFYFEVQ